MRRLQAILAALTTLVLVSGLFPGPALGLTDRWTDDFVDASLVGQSEGVAVVSGAAQLARKSPIREGLRLGGPGVVEAPTVVRSGTGYLMYVGESTNSAINVAASVDAVTWARVGVAITPGFSGQTDSVFVDHADVVLVGGTYHMWYSGWDGSAFRIHLATSIDGLNWTAGRMVLDTEIIAGVSNPVYAPAVAWDGSRFVMWYTAFDGTYSSIRRAVSSDGIAWTRTGPVLERVPGSNDNAGPRQPTVEHLESQWMMWYACVPTWEGKICRASSADGVSWTREGIELDIVGSLPGEDVGLSNPEFLEVQPGLRRLWYSSRGSMNQIYSAVLPIGFLTSGSLRSVPVPLPSGFYWRWLEVQREPLGGGSIVVSLIDEASGEVIAGYSDLAASNSSLDRVDSVRIRGIVLQARIQGTGSTTPLLDRWTLVYSTTPPPARVDLGSGYRTLLVFATLAVTGTVVTLVVLRDRRLPRI